MNITELENSFAKKIGSEYCIAVNSGTSALHACLHAMGVGYGDEVISPGLTVMMNTFATLYVGAVPVYADVEADTFVIDPDTIEYCITEKTKAIQIVSLYGLPCNINAIKKVADKHGLMILEDNAQCLLGKYSDGRTAGSVADMSIFSTESTKHISSGEGGFICTNSGDLAIKARKFAGLGYQTLRANEGRPKLNKEMFHMNDVKRHDVLGFNYRMPQLCVDALAPQVRSMEEIVDRRVKNALGFDSVLSGSKYFSPQQNKGCSNSYWAYTVSYSGPVEWKEFYKRFRKNGGEGFHGCYSLPYREPVMIEYSYRAVCHVAERIQPTLMQFHTNYKTDEELDVQLEALHKTVKSIDE